MSGNQDRPQWSSVKSGGGVARDYDVTGRGVNEQGNKWDTRDYGEGAPNQNPYHYSNQDDSYYYSNPDGSRYHNDGQGMETYHPPGCDEPLYRDNRPVSPGSPDDVKSGYEGLSETGMDGAMEREGHPDYSEGGYADDIPGQAGYASGEVQSSDHTEQVPIEADDPYVEASSSAGEGYLSEDAGYVDESGGSEELAESDGTGDEDDDDGSVDDGYGDDDYGDDGYADDGDGDDGYAEENES